MLKLIDILNSKFPDNEGYRLTDVQRVFKDGNIYKLLLTFKKIVDARKKYYSEDINEKSLLKEFRTGRTILKEGNIAYARLFVIGSIWWNKGTPSAVTPNYLHKYSFDSKMLFKGNLIQCNTSDFTDEHSMGSEFVDMNNIVKVNFPRILCYDLIETKFIAFHSYEVYRYFFTSYSITDLNSRMFNYAQFTENGSTENTIYNNEISDNKEDKHLVYLKNPYDLKDASIIGNIVHIYDFKRAIIKMQNYLNKSSIFQFSAIEKLPVSKFDLMTVSAKRVKRKSDGAEGLMILQIHECRGYLDYSYTPVIPKIINSKDGKASGGKGRRKPNVSPSGFEPRVVNDHTTGMGADTVDLNILGLEDLFKPSNDVKLDEILYKIFDSEGKPFLRKTPNDNLVSPPGNFGDESGKRPKEKIDVEPTNYFVFFTEIIEKISLTLNKNGLDTKVSYINEDLTNGNTESKINCNKLKIAIKEDPNPNWSLYLAHIHVVSQNSYNNFYLFEKYSTMRSAGRTWLYSFNNFQESEEEKLLSKIKEFLTENKNSRKDRFEPDLKFNHTQSKKDKLSEKEYTEIEKDEAINNHVMKICNSILKVYGLKSLQLFQIA